MSRSALITGVTGFIGGRLAERLLAEGWTVHALLRPSSEAPPLPKACVHRHDGTVDGLTAIVREAAPDVVFHLASLYLTEHRPEQVGDLVASNILLPAQLAEAMSAAGATRLVNTGTAWQHFNTDSYNPVNLYAATKQAAEDLLLYFHNTRGLSVLTLKLFDTFGPDDKRRKLVRIVLDAACSGEELGMSPGEQIVDLTHVDDVVEAFLLAALRLLKIQGAVLESFFVSGCRMSVRHLVAEVGTAVERPIGARFGERTYRAREVMVPLVPTSADLLPGWSPSRGLHEAIRERVEEGAERTEGRSSQ